MDPLEYFQKGIYFFSLRTLALALGLWVVLKVLPLHQKVPPE